MKTDIPAKLSQFVAAQDAVYAEVLRELSAGRKRSHWIWYIFPQMCGLGFSSLSQKFGIGSKEEAAAYLSHEILGPRLRECTRLILAVPHGDIESVMGYPDDLKFRSSMTLFAAVAPDEPLFADALQKYFAGEPDLRTLELLRAAG
jgi:uncharacterized protein (DUF1810 family)